MNACTNCRAVTKALTEALQLVTSLSLALEEERQRTATLLRLADELASLASIGLAGSKKP